MLTLGVVAAQSVLTVFAAASLHAAFPELGKQFEAMHPGVTVRFNFNGSQILEAQLEAGAQADIFASADKPWMDAAVKAGVAGAPESFATNQMVIVANSGSGIKFAQDLAKPGKRIVLCVAVAPCGRYARKALAVMDADPSLGQNFSASVLRNVSSEELDVEAVLEKVSLGEADAGIVYRSDVATQTQAVRVIALPPLRSLPIAYYIGTVRSSATPTLAAQFVRFVRSQNGQRILDRFGFAAVR